MMKLSSKKTVGFTLIELVLVIMLVSIVAVIGSVVLGQGMHAFVDFQNITDADWQIRVALETMTREIRNIRYSSDITVASATQLSFVDNNGKSVSFSLSGNTLMENSQVLADGISSMTFTYYNSALSITTTPSAVVLVELQITFTKNNTSTTTQLFWFPRNTIA
jgi:prepilin-type N-terminal cleavage/methylation domain-containing protein